ncbi:MAG: glycoside hydrolase family protein [Ruminococcus sp.]|nr:glycoside hydrolase family protein [Ruminococcus sp.]
MVVKTYSLKKDGNKFLSDHFQVKEFASIGQGKTYSDTVLIDSALVTLLEKVYKHFNCSSIVISSCYRTAAHDIAVGGSGSGYHVKGQAADFCCYDKNKKAIESKKIVLYLEDIKCYGIGYKCGGSTTYTHADTRAASAKWWGDESRNFLDISQLGGYSSFYDYLGVSKSTTATGKKTMKLSTDGLNLIKSYEGLSLKACKALPTEQYYTIGYGHYGPDVKPGQTITQAAALRLLNEDCKKFVNAVNKALKVSVTQNQFDAMVSLAYNIGVNGFAESDLVKYLNAGKFFKACAEFPLWRRDEKKNIVPGLQNRRTKELKRFIVDSSVTLTDKMNVRSGAATSKKVVKVLASGSKIKITDVVVNYSSTAIDIWGKCSAGWVCLKQGSTFYAK